MKTTIFHKSKHAIVNKHTYTKGPYVGDYFFTVHSKNGQFINKFSNRLFKEAIQAAASYKISI